MRSSKILKCILISVPIYFIVFIWWLLNDTSRNSDLFGEFKRELLFPPGGPVAGDGGKPYVFDTNSLSGLQFEEYKHGYDAFGFNTYASERIELNRSLKDVRAKKCRAYDEVDVGKLPRMTVAMVVKDVQRSVLLRSVYSIVLRTPAHVLSRILIVDDNSFLSQTVDALHVLAKLPKITVTRPPAGEKLILSKVMMAIASDPNDAPIVFMVDPHVEVMHHWAEPILNYLQNNKRALAVPTVDVIDKDTFEYQPITTERGTEFLNVFNWFFDQQMVRIPEQERDKYRSETKPYREPTMMGIVAFWHTYLQQMIPDYNPLSYETNDIANLDLSFRSWMCGGGIYHIPCSRVGHLYAAKVTKQDQAHFIDRVEDSFTIAKLWTDKYMEHHCSRFGKDHCPKLEEKFDLTLIIKESLKQRRELYCQPFDWYMKNIANIVFIPKDVVKCGQLVNEGYGHELCLHHFPWEEQGQMFVKPCLDPILPRSQYFMLTKSGQIRQDVGCMSFDLSTLQKKPCKDGDRSQQWLYTQDGIIQHIKTGQCLKISTGDLLEMFPCKYDITQQWKFKSSS